MGIELELCSVLKEGYLLFTEHLNGKLPHCVYVTKR